MRGEGAETGKSAGEPELASTALQPCPPSLYRATENSTVDRDELLKVRVSKKEKQGFAEAAKVAGIPLSAWARERLRRAAVMQLEEANMDVPFIDRLD